MPIAMPATQARVTCPPSCDPGAPDLGAGPVAATQPCRGRHGWSGRWAALALAAALGAGTFGADLAMAQSTGASSPQRAVPTGRVIVHWRDGATAVAPMAAGGDRVQRLSARLRLQGLQPGRSITERLQVVTAQGLTSAQLVERLSRDPDVVSVEVDRRLKRAQAAPNDPRFASWPLAQGGPVAGQWYLKAPDATLVSATNAVGGWTLSTGRRAVVVAVLDTGVRFDHPDLLPLAQGGNLLTGRDFIAGDDATRTTDGAATGGTRFATAADGDGRDGDPTDPGDFLTRAEIDANADVFAAPGEECLVEPQSSWHGTQVAGLIGASTDNGRGVASVGRTVRVLPVRVLGKCGGYTSDIAAAMRWAAGLPVPGEPVNPTPAWVLNLSLGGGTGSCDQSPTLKTTVEEVTAAGAVVVVAAGNSNGQAVSRPANCPGAVAVGAVRHTGTKVGFSDLGPEIALMAPGGNCVNLNGDCLYPIVSTTNAGAQQPVAASEAYTDARNFAVGTSFSSPLVAGAAALILSVRPDLTAAQVRTALQAGARSFPAVDASLPVCRAPSAAVQDECNCTSTTCGAGLLDVERAVRAALTLPSGGLSRPDTSVTPTPPPPPPPAPSDGGGGGAVGAGWVLALFAAAAALGAGRRRRSVPA